MLDVILHLNVHLAHVASQFGVWTYLILFAIIYAETGFIIAPFLPGDSLLFAVGALAATPESELNVVGVIVTLTVAAILGDGTNYWIGSTMGERFLKTFGRWINPEHLKRTEQFYARHGGKTIVLARFIPIVRTFAPFVAGVAHMKRHQFTLFNAIGGIAWVAGLTLAGYGFGNIPSIQRNFHVVVVVIVAISFLPLLFEYVRSKRSAVSSR